MHRPILQPVGHLRLARDDRAPIALHLHPGDERAHSALIGWDAWWRILAVAAFAYLVVGVKKNHHQPLKKRRVAPVTEGHAP